MPRDDSSNASPGRDATIRDALYRMLSTEEDRNRKRLHTGEPCTVVAYKPPGQVPTPKGPVTLPARVDVRMGHLRTKREKLPDGTETVIPYGTEADGSVVNRDCPIVLPGFGPIVIFPSADGTELIGQWGWLTPNSRYPAPVMTALGVPSVSTLREVRHDMSNGFFIPGVYPGVTNPTFPGSAPGQIKLGALDGSWSLSVDTAVNPPNVTLSTLGATLTLDALTEVKGGANALETLIKQTFVSVMDTMIASAISAAAGVIPPNGDGGTAAFTAFQIAWDTAKANITTIKLKGE